MPLQAVIFDFDGLIVDTETPEYESWGQEFISHGLTLDLKDWSQCVGAGPSAWDVFDHLEKQLGRPIDRTQIAESRERRHQAIVENLAPREGLLPLLQEVQAHGLPYAIASSSELVWVTKYLARLDLAQEFEFIWTRDQVTSPKPAPDLYLAACQSLGISPQNSIALEDSTNGIRAAKSAGLKVIAVPNPVTATFDLSEADAIVPSLSEVSVDQMRMLFWECEGQTSL